MIAGKPEIRDMLPQGESMIMIDAITSYTENTVTTSFEITPSCFFVENGKLSTEGMIENMAQTAIAGSFTKKKQQSKPVNAFIGAITRLNVTAYARQGSTIHTKIEQKTNLGNMFLVAGTILLNETSIATCDLKIVFGN
ncbi:MAG TPA: hypothetical protein VK177_12810 [Flavobacteriales bacterium]|nr:hypothetical protein [Flavobacteriales bacterium]